MSDFAELTNELKGVTRLIRNRVNEPASKATDAAHLKEGVPSRAEQVLTFGRSNSNGFRLGKALGCLAGVISEEDAGNEIDASNHFRKALADCGQLSTTAGKGVILVHLDSKLLPDEVTTHQGYKVMKSMWTAGAEGVDRDEIRWLARNGDTDVVRKTAMSYLVDTIGGTLVAPPVQGELIELIRPREALLNAGATTVPLPTQGRIVYPRQTGASTMYWVGENVSITESNPTTGQIALQAKKGAVYVTVPNELLRYSSVAADALIRTDTAKTIALGIDYAGLYGAGGATQPRGLSTYTASNEVIVYQSASPTPAGVATNGNVLRPEDGYRMIGLVEDRNFQFNGWIFRPTMANNIAGFRGDAASPGDKAGQFVQSLIRGIADKLPVDTWCGYPVTKSATVRNNLSKGSGSNLTEVFGGQWEHFLIGMHGAVEFASSSQAGSTFQQDQTAIRALVHVDAVPRYEGAFVMYQYLLNQV